MCPTVFIRSEGHEYVLHVDVRSKAFPIWVASNRFPTDGFVGVDIPGLQYETFNVSMTISQFIGRQFWIMSTPS